MYQTAPVHAVGRVAFSLSGLRSHFSRFTGIAVVAGPTGTGRAHEGRYATFTHDEPKARRQARQPDHYAPLGHRFQVAAAAASPGVPRDPPDRGVTVPWQTGPRPADRG